MIDFSNEYAANGYDDTVVGITQNAYPVGTAAHKAWEAGARERRRQVRLVTHEVFTPADHSHPFSRPAPDPTA